MFILCLVFSVYMAVLYADEKEKYDPSAFRDSIVQGLTEAQGDIEQVWWRCYYSFYISCHLPFYIQFKCIYSCIFSSWALGSRGVQNEFFISGSFILGSHGFVLIWISESVGSVCNLKLLYVADVSLTRLIYKHC